MDTLHIIAWTILATLVIVSLLSLIAMLIVNKRRHTCTFCLVKTPREIIPTKKVCRIYRVGIDPTTPPGMVMVEVYIFRVCTKYQHHVSSDESTQKIPHILWERKSRLYPIEKYNALPSKEKDFVSEETQALFRAAGVLNPNFHPLREARRGKS